MNSLSIASVIVPVPRTPISIRAATLADLPFIDALQKQHTRQLGYFPTKQFEDYIARGEVLVAEAMGDGRWEMGDVGMAGAGREGPGGDSGVSISHLPSHISHPTPVGYVISRDRYLKRDELGVIYQLCVVPGKQRGLIGASLIKEAFARSAYGCRLYCCWCAQDLEANYFWEAMGFVPVAFRGGSGKKKRVHIFWQRRICADDVETKYWYPFQTNSGAIREDRLVFPIPPGVRWSDPMPRVLPGGTEHHGDTEDTEKRGGPQMTQIEARTTNAVRKSVKSGQSVDRSARSSPCPPCLRGNRALQTPPPGMAAILVGGRIKYVARKGSAGMGDGRCQMGDGKTEAPAQPALLAAASASVHLPSTLSHLPSPPVPAKRKPTMKHDLKHVAAARELRDRWMEQVNAHDAAALLSRGKYEVGRKTMNDERKTMNEDQGLSQFNVDRSSLGVSSPPPPLLGGPMRKAG